MAYRVIYIDEQGNVEKITDGYGKEIEGKPEEEDPKSTPLVTWSQARRCVYPGNGKCYC
jgi:hypothetical protein